MVCPTPLFTFDAWQYHATPTSDLGCFGGKKIALQHVGGRGRVAFLILHVKLPESIYMSYIYTATTIMLFIRSNSCDTVFVCYQPLWSIPKPLYSLKMFDAVCPRTVANICGSPLLVYECVARPWNHAYHGFNCLSPWHHMMPTPLSPQ